MIEMKAFSDSFMIGPLLPRHRIYFCAWLATHEDADRFSSLFRAVWRRLPRDVRREILALWRSRIETLDAAPTVLATGERIVKNRRGTYKFAPAEVVGKHLKVRRAAGTTELGGFQIKFRADYIRDLAPFAAELIAHELAHVYQHAAGHHTTLEQSEDREAVETDARRLTKQWGFYFGDRGHVSSQYAKKAIAAASRVAPKDPIVLAQLQRLHGKKGGA